MCALKNPFFIVGGVIQDPDPEVFPQADRFRFHLIQPPPADCDVPLLPFHHQVNLIGFGHFPVVRKCQG